MAQAHSLKSLSEILFLSFFIGLSVSACETFAGMRRAEARFVRLFVHSFVFETRFLTEPGVDNLTMLAGQQASQGSSVSAAGITATAPAFFLYFQDLMAVRRALY